MRYNSLFQLLKKAILFKRKRKTIKEAKELVKAKIKLPITNKRKLLKKLYTRILINTPYEDNIPIFMKLIDMVPDSYLDYELGMNLENAYEFVNELIIGTGDLTDDEIANLGNIVAGIGIPALEKYASGEHKVSKKTGKFGSEAINKNVEEFLSSLKKRRSPEFKLPAPEPRGLVKQTKELVHPDSLVKLQDVLSGIFSNLKIKKDSPFWAAASKIQSKGINVERLAKSIAKSPTYTEDRKKYETAAKKQGVAIEFKTDEFFTFFNEIRKQQKEREHAKLKEGYIKV
jgi:hypothetical protein